MVHIIVQRIYLAVHYPTLKTQILELKKLALFFALKESKRLHLVDSQSAASYLCFSSL